MKKLGDIMEDLGFRPEGSDEVKKAFIKNLIRQANEQEAKQRFSNENEKSPMKTSPEKSGEANKQLSLFNQKKSS